MSKGAHMHEDILSAGKQWRLDSGHSRYYT